MTVKTRQKLRTIKDIAKYMEDHPVPKPTVKFQLGQHIVYRDGHYVYKAVITRIPDEIELERQLAYYGNTQQLVYHVDMTTARGETYRDYAVYEMNLHAS